MWPTRVIALVFALVLGGSACGGAPAENPRAVDAAVTTTTGPTTTSSPPATSALPAAPATTAARPPTTRPPVSPAPVLVRYRVEVRTTDAETADFPSVVEATLDDARGWERAAFVIERTDDAPYLVVIAEGDEVDRLCLPYDTYGRYSCQNGPVVAINADRWRHATPKWTGDLPTYRQMLVNHEFGHLLGQHHPDRQCPRQGQPAPIMAQQSTELDGCLPNPWPLPHEIARAARHDEPLAPPYSR